MKFQTEWQLSIVADSSASYAEAKNLLTAEKATREQFGETWVMSEELLTRTIRIRLSKAVDNLNEVA